MAEKIYTIPINEAFDKTLESETPDCPLCLMRNMLEKNELERVGRTKRAFAVTISI